MFRLASRLFAVLFAVVSLTAMASAGAAPVVKSVWEHPIMVTFVLVGLTSVSGIGAWLIRQMMEGQKGITTISAILKAHIDNEDKQVEVLSNGIERVANQLEVTNTKLDTIDEDHKQLQLQLTREMTRVTTLVDTHLGSLSKP